MNPTITAKYLIGKNFPIEKYKEIQVIRKARLLFWEEKGIQVLITAEKELIQKGEIVLQKMKEAYGTGK